MNLNNRNDMSLMKCTSDINTDYCMNPIKMKKGTCRFKDEDAAFPCRQWDHQGEGISFFNVRWCSPGAIHLQRPVGSLPKTR